MCSEGTGEIGLARSSEPANGIYEKIPLRSMMLADSIPVRKGFKKDIENVIRIVADKTNGIWVLTHAGLLKMDPNTLEVEIYNENDGFQMQDEVLRVHTMNQLEVLSTGELLVGFRKGIGLFDPGKLSANQELPIPYLTAFKIFNEDYRKGAWLNSHPQIDLAHDQNYFSLEFSSIGYTLPKKKLYKYQMEGVNKEWIEAGHRNFASYTNIKRRQLYLQSNGRQ